MTSIYNLPELGSDAAQRTELLSTRIREEIHSQGGHISFAKFMEMALYHPEYGYYTGPSIAIGKQGDFTTAPEISPLFAKCFAQQIIQIAEIFGNANVLEIGAGTGRLAKDLLIELERLSYLPGHYYIYEISPSLRKAQAALISTECPDLLQHVVWLDTLPENFSGVIVANEVLDALPVHRFRVEESGIKERCVAWKNGEFTWQSTEPTAPELATTAQHITDLYSLFNDYESEINLRSQPFISAAAKTLARGVILIADYGYGQKEYYRPERRHGTLTCFFQHQKHDDPLFMPGLQDITAHVDFTRVIETAADHGCSLKGYTTQASFLLACGLMNIVAEEEVNLTALELVKLHHAIKLLTMPTEMGDVVKVMALSKKVEIPLIGFNLRDRRRDL